MLVPTNTSFMENEEKQILRNVLQRIHEIEVEKDKTEKPQKDNIMAKNDDSKILVTNKVIINGIFRALSYAAAAFIIVTIIIKFFNKNEVPVTMDKVNVIHDTVVIKSGKNDAQPEMRKMLRRSIDSLSILFTQEVAGENGSKKTGYGSKAKEIKKQIDSLRIALYKMDDN